MPDFNDTFIVEGLRCIGIGKKGTKHLSEELSQNIIQDLDDGNIPDEIKGAFWGALIVKGIHDTEECLLQYLTESVFSNPHIFVQMVLPNLPKNIQPLYKILLEKRTLSLQEAEALGDFLFSDLPGNTARGLAASILRVRYETPDEYEGLLNAMQNTFVLEFQNVSNSDRLPLIQIADPFDGVKRTNMILPIVADYLQSLNYSVLTLIGRTSGPKFGHNIFSMMEYLKISSMSMASDLKSNIPYGNYIDQKVLSPAMDRWVDIRRHIKKRPFLATLERFINPLKADICIASAFHPAYGEKMLTIAERNHFPAVIIVRNGMEGGIAFPLKRPVKILISVKQKNGSFLRHELEFWAEKELDQHFKVEEKLDHVSLKDNARLIETHLKDKKTGHAFFDVRVQATCLGLEKAIRWIEKHR